jgi:hypothetical protein
MQFEAVRERLVGAVESFHDRVGGSGRFGAPLTQGGGARLT